MKPKQPHGPPMTLGNMRELGVALIDCQALGRRCFRRHVVCGLVRLSLGSLSYLATATPAGNLLVALVLLVLCCVWQGILSRLADFLL
jgi:hypothetical protein